MTPNEAMQKWCPMRTANLTQSGEIRDTHNNVVYNVVTTTQSSSPDFYNCFCVATRCMMWRKHALDSDDGNCGLAGFAMHSA